MDDATPGSVPELALVRDGEVLVPGRVRAAAGWEVAAGAAVALFDICPAPDQAAATLAATLAVRIRWEGQDLEAPWPSAWREGWGGASGERI
ncbi:MAG: hypothetical protein ACREN7_03070 [Candidatus Dormibacteria bacterium]